MANRDKSATDFYFLLGFVFGTPESQAGHTGVIAEHLIDDVIPDHLNISVVAGLGQQLLLHDLLAAELVAAVAGVLAPVEADAATDTAVADGVMDTVAVVGVVDTIAAAGVAMDTVVVVGVVDTIAAAGVATDTIVAVGAVDIIVVVVVIGIAVASTDTTMAATGMRIRGG